MKKTAFTLAALLVSSVAMAAPTPPTPQPIPYPTLPTQATSGALPQLPAQVPAVAPITVAPPTTVVPPKAH